MVGLIVGEADDGLEVGYAVGLVDGLAVGLEVGAVGFLVGATVGLSVGLHVSPTPVGLRVLQRWRTESHVYAFSHLSSLTFNGATDVTMPFL